MNTIHDKTLTQRTKEENHEQTTIKRAPNSMRTNLIFRNLKQFKYSYVCLFHLARCVGYALLPDPVP